MTSLFVGMLAMSTALAGVPTLDIGLEQMQVRDDLVVPLRSSGGGIAPGIGWRDDGGPHHSRVHFALPIALFTNSHGHLGVTWSLDLDGSWDAELAALAGGRLALGVAASGDIDQYMHTDWDDSHLFWSTHWGLGPRAAWRRPVEGHQLELWTSLPVVVLASRPPEVWQSKVNDIVEPLAQLGTAHGDVHLTSVHQAVDWHGGATWSGPRARGGSRALFTEARVASTSFPARITSVTVLVGVERRWGTKGSS